MHATTAGYRKINATLTWPSFLVVRLHRWTTCACLPGCPPTQHEHVAASFHTASLGSGSIPGSMVEGNIEHSRNIRQLIMAHWRRTWRILPIPTPTASSNPSSTWTDAAQAKGGPGMAWRAAQQLARTGEGVMHLLQSQTARFRPA